MTAARFGRSFPWYRPTVILFLVAVGIRLLVLSRFASEQPLLPQSDDMKFYADWAVRITEGKWSDGHAFYGLPGYAFTLAGVFALLGANQFFVGILQIFLEAFTTVLIFKIARETLSSSQKSDDSTILTTAVAGSAALGWVFYQPAQTFSTILMPSAWLVAAFWGSVWWVVKHRASASRWHWLALGVFTGLVAMMVATILFLLPLFLAAIISSVDLGKPWRARLLGITAAVSLLFGGTLVGTAPAWLHNYVFARDPVLLSAHSGLNFWMGNNPDANGYPKIPDGLSAGQEGLLRDSITRAEQAAGHELKRSEVSKFWSAKADAWVRENRGAWLRLLGVKLRNFWNAFQYDDLSEINLLRDTGVLTPGLRFGVVAALGLPGLLWACWRFSRARWVAGAVLLHMLALLPVFITERYRLCAVPGLLIFAAFTIGEIWQALARGRWVVAGGLLFAVAASSWFVSLPQPAPELWALDPFNTGLKHLRAGRFALAQTRLETAHALVPENAEINFGLGNLWFQKEDFDRARTFYQSTLALQPRHTGALNNLGRLEALAGKWAAGEGYLRASIAIDPDAQKPRLFLADLLLAKGDAAGAQTIVDDARARWPAQPQWLELETKTRDLLR